MHDFTAQLVCIAGSTCMSWSDQGLARAYLTKYVGKDAVSQTGPKYP